MQKKQYFGNYARKTLRFTLPFMVFFAFALTVYVARLDTLAFAKEEATILLLLETMGRLSFCVALATVLADIAERKTKKEDIS